MNFEEMQLIWDEQNKRTMFAFDREALERVVAKEGRAIRFELSSLEFAAVFGMLGSAVVTASETLSEGKEYFQLGEAGVMIVLAVWIYLGRRQAESRAKRIGEGILGEVDRSVLRTERLIGLWRWCVAGFWFISLSSVLIRRVVYRTFEHAEIKVILAIVGPTLLYLFVRRLRKKVHEPRLTSLGILRGKLAKAE